MRGLVPVVVGQLHPVGAEVLGQEPVAVSRSAVDQSVGDGEAALVPHGIPRGVAHGDERLEAVHVGIGAAVALGVRPVGRERLAQALGRLVPEPALDDLDGLAEQGGGRGCPTVSATADGEPDVHVVVGRLAGHRAGLGEPAAVLGVGVQADQRRHRVVEQVAGTRDAVAHPDRRRVGHPGGEEELRAPPGQRRPVGSLPGEPAPGRIERQREGEHVGRALGAATRGARAVEPRALPGQAAASAVVADPSRRTQLAHSGCTSTR